MNLRGIGDRWLAGQPVDGINFGFRSRVEVSGGRHDGERGVVVLLMGVESDPLYLVELASTGANARLRQSLLRHADAA